MMVFGLASIILSSLFVSLLMRLLQIKPSEFWEVFGLVSTNCTCTKLLSSLWVIMQSSAECSNFLARILTKGLECTEIFNKPEVLNFFTSLSICKVSDTLVLIVYLIII